MKPHIVRSLANAELYCMALSHLYADPNFHNLNHWGIIQALARKGICVSEPPDCALTETMLIQTTPLKMVRFELFSGHRLSVRANWIKLANLGLFSKLRSSHNSKLLKLFSIS